MDDIQEKIDKTQLYISDQNVGKAISAAKLAHQILDEIALYLAPGMRESALRDYAMTCFTRHGIERTWHPPYMRFADHTLLTFMDKAKEDYVLQDNDIAFIDIGIVKNGIEGDAGKTLCFGSNAEHEKLRNASVAIFHEAVDFWYRQHPTGMVLYDYIYTLAQKMDVVWNLDPAGHLIGAFPHRGWKHGINTFPEMVESGKWILEIQIRHKTLPVGAFYEDLLYCE